MEITQVKALNTIEDFLKSELISIDPKWELYREPFLNGERPDFVCLNPSKGIFIIKYLNFTQNNYDVENDKIIDIRTNTITTLQNPLSYFERLRNSIQRLYLPRLGEKAFAFRAITCCIIMNEERDQSLKFLQSFTNFGLFQKNVNQFRLGNLNNLKLSEVFPDHKTNLSKLMTEDLAMDFRNWLYTPDFKKEFDSNISMPKRQWDLISSVPKTKFRKIKGSAGSGKSFVLCGRAVHLVKEEKKRVLVVTYNITLINYLRDLCDAFYPNVQNLISFIHFHEWMNRAFSRLGIPVNYDFSKEGKDKSTNSKLEHVLPMMLLKALEDNDHGLDKYDAILVDEGQDFNIHWWSALRHSLKTNGEMLLVADTAQDIYIRQLNSWIEDPMKNTGLSGSWTQLNDSFRIPNNVKPLLNRFQNQFLAKKNVNLFVSPQADLMDCYIKWRDIDEEQASNTCVEELLLLIKEDINQKRSFTDLTFLTDDQEIGLKVVDQLRDSNKSIKVAHTFELIPNDPKQKYRKMVFTKLSATVKATTIHSFKGWESRMIVLLITRAKTPKDFAVIYTGLSRIKYHKRGSFLTIVNTTPKLKNYLLN